MSAHLEANLRALAAADPDRAVRVLAAAPLAALPVASRTGAPTLEVDGVLLHNRHDPVREATRWAQAQVERLAAARATTAVVLGFGLGYHVEALAAAWEGRIVVVEPDDALLRTALAARDLRGLFGRATLAPEPLSPEAIDAWVPVAILAHAPSLLREGAGLRAARERIAGRTVLRERRLRVLVVSAVTGGSYPMAQYCGRAIQELGHEVAVLDLAPFAGGLHAIPTFSPKRPARRALQESFTRFLGSGVVATAEALEPDLVLALAQAPLDPTTLADLRARGFLTALWFVEDHRLFEYWREVAPHYDHVFAIQQGPFLDEAQRLTNGRAGYLPCAADPQVHRPLVLTAAERAELGAPVGFVGAGYFNRRIAFRPLLELGLKIWGTEWDGGGQVEAAVQRAGARISTEDSVRIFNATDVNLNLHSSTYVDGVDPRGDFVNPRTFELAAAGAFQLVDRRTLLPPLLVPETEVVTFTEARELPELVRWWLAHPEERARVAAAGRARVRGAHTYRHRMETLLETVCARDVERLQARPHAETVGDVAAAEGDTPLGRLLAELPPAVPFKLDDVVGAILRREGDLSDAESTLMFLQQFDDMFVREHRT